MTFNLEQFLSLFLCMTLTFLKSTGQLFCRMSLSLGLPDVSLWVNSAYAFLESKCHRSNVVSVSRATHQVAHDILSYFFLTFWSTGNSWLKYCYECKYWFLRTLIFYINWHSNVKTSSNFSISFIHWVITHWYHFDAKLSQIWPVGTPQAGSCLLPKHFLTLWQNNTIQHLLYFLCPSHTVIPSRSSGSF